MLPHPLHKRILSRVIFYSGVAVIAVLMRLAMPEPNAQTGLFEDSTDSEPATAYYAFPSSQ